ncbi:MAG TPA: PfkB family carbohydrate kinase [Gemmataceae bacterium]|nr:PfkB family carbohydrate kinase [Gemmataceae bacterium]
MLTEKTLGQILERLPGLTLGVIGDVFLDRYLDIDAALTEPSLETGLDAYQVFRVRSSPGAAGTVINNLVALGVKRVCAVSVIGDDGEGYELRQALGHLRIVEDTWVCSCGGRRTPTYTKPLLHRVGESPRELNRLDIKNRTRLPAAAEDGVLRALAEVWPRIDALLVLDQVSEPDCGVVTARVRERLAGLGDADPTKVILADSRERIGLFRSVWLKPNESECRRATRDMVGAPESARFAVEACVEELARQAGRPVFCTLGGQGILVVDARLAPPRAVTIPAYPVDRPIDSVGAGDSTSAGIACALAAGARLEDAAAFGNLVAAVTIQQIGTTGTATPEQLRQQWAQARA